MRFPAGFFVFALIVVATLWWWMGLPVRVPAADAPAVKAACLSYAPFRGHQSPFTPGTHIERTQIEQDLAQLAEVTADGRGAHMHGDAFAAGEDVDRARGDAPRLSRAATGPAPE